MRTLVKRRGVHHLQSPEMAAVALDPVRGAAPKGMRTLVARRGVHHLQSP